MTDKVLHHLDYQKAEVLVIERFDDIVDKDGQIEFSVKWKTFSEDEKDWLSESLLREDLTDLFRKHLVDVSKSVTQRQQEVGNRLL